MKKKFQITLALLEAKPDISIDFKSIEMTEDIQSARDNFNIYHKGTQKLEIKKIEKSMIEVELELDVKENEVVELYRKIGLFSRRLYHKYGWKRFSNLPNRLLTLVSSNELSCIPIITEVDIQEQFTADHSAEIINMKKEKLRYLLAEKRYVELQIQELEQEGIIID